ncbi:MAG TPA: phosphoheptose isomerase [Candidatus Omnitrophica bacterium]|nr:phosphoheptose isomerase [Candidatus Omnitrophota bacterium]
MFTYFEKLNRLFMEMEASDKNRKRVDISSALKSSVELIKKTAGKGNKIMFIGNGGSASISSHMAIDFWKNSGIKAVSFNDSAQLTCLGNDFGYEHVFEKPIEFFAETGDVLIAISSSGKSKNILKGVKAARLKKCKVITMSGFSKNNPLRKMGYLNFYVPSDSYGFVEIAHGAICHLFADYTYKKPNG